MNHFVYISIGTNLGDKEKNYTDALRHIASIAGVKIIKESKRYKTEALTTGDAQPAYINGAIKIETTLLPETLLDELQRIEQLMGREADHKKWDPRVIDLDILFYGDLVIKSGRLTIPHPELSKRMFVLEPLCDIGAELLHPVLKKTIRELKESL